MTETQGTVVRQVVRAPESGWQVYRVSTQSSQYTLGVFEGNGTERPCVVLRGHSRGQPVHAQDSAPLVGGRPVFQVPTAEWVGKVLEVGMVKTSRVERVEKESDVALVRAVTTSVGYGAAQPATTTVGYVAVQPTTNTRPRSSYPEDYVERIEAAAELLSSCYRRRGLVEDLQQRPALLERYKVAFAECVLMVKALGGN